MKKITTFLLTVILSLLIATSVYAAESIELKSTKNKVNLGEEIIVSLELNLENEEETSLYAYTAKLSYDKDVFEVIDESNFEESENWSDITYNKNNNKFALINKNGETENNILQIKLKVKENAIPGNTSITVNNIKASNGKKDIILKGKTIDVMVIKDGLAEGESIPTNNENDILEDSSNSAIEVKNDFSWVGYVLIVLIAILIIFTIFYFIKSKKKGISRNKRIVIIVILILSVLGLLGATISILSNKKADINKDGQINDDDTKDIIEYLLEIKNPEENTDISDRDLNRDGQLTIGDVAESVNQSQNQSNGNGSNSSNRNRNSIGLAQTTNPSTQSNPNSSTEPNNPSNPSNPEGPSNPNDPTEPNNPSNPSNPEGPSNPNSPTEPNNPSNPSNPEGPSNPNHPTEPNDPSDPTESEKNVKVINCKLTNENGEEIYYVEKNQKIKLIYNFETNFSESINYVILNYVKLPVIKNEDGTYTVTFNAPEKVGKQEIALTKIGYEENKELDVPYSCELEVLKSIKMSVMNIKVNTSQENPVLTYDMQDPEDTFVSGKIILTETETNQSQEISIKKDVTSYTLENVKELIQYDTKVEFVYDFDEDKTNTNHQETETVNGINFNFIKDYKLKVSDLEVVKVEQSTKTVKLKFNSTNVSDYKIAYVKVKGKDEKYGVGYDSEDNIYTFEYKIDDEVVSNKKRTEIVLDSVTLQNGKDLNVTDSSSAVIFKTKPKVTNIATEVQENRSIKTTFDLEDNEKTLKYLYVSLKDSEGNESGETILEKTEDGNFGNEVRFDVITPDIYKVVVRGAFDVVDGEEHDRDEIMVSENTAEIKIDAHIISGIVSNKYPEKNDKIDIEYEIGANIEDVPTKVTLNDKQEYELTPTEEGKYKVLGYQVPSVAGFTNIEVTRVYFGDNRFVEFDTPYENQIDVLKDVPTFITTQEDMVKLKTVLFNIEVNDPDNAMISGKANVNEENAVLKSNASIQMPVKIEEENSVHTLKINIDYDRDSNTIEEEEPQNENKISESKNFSLISDYGLEISNLKLVKKETQDIANYVTKGEHIQLRFNSTNKTELIPTKIFLNDVKNADTQDIMYEVKKVEDSEDEYYVDLNANNKAGLQEFEVKNILLADEKTIASDEIQFNNITPLKVTVLKDVPKMDNYNSTNSENSVTVTFNITDEDNALKTESQIKLINSSDNREVSSFDINKGENTHVFDKLELGKPYTLRIENRHSLSDDGSHEYTTVFKEEIIIISKEDAPNFKIKNLEITERVPIGSKVQVSFENSVMSYKDVNKVTIDGVEYPISKDEKGVYKLKLNPEKKGINTINIQNAKIDDMVFNVSRPLSYIYEYIVPEAKDVTEISEEGGKAIIKYKLADPDNSIKEMTAYMKTPSGSIAAEMKLEGYKANDNTINTIEMPLLKLNSYSIELRASCDIGDGTIEDKKLDEKEKNSPAQVTVIENEIEKEYVEKGERVVLKFKINTNVDSDVKQIYVNNECYNAEKVVEIVDKQTKVVPDTYTVTVEAPYESGVFVQEVTNIQIGNNFLAAEYSKEIENNKIAIKVLKDAPKLTHFIVDEKEKNVTFKINDGDSALSKSKKLKLTVKQGEQEVGSEELNIGDKDYNLNLDKIGMTSTEYPASYDITVNATYDRRPDVSEKINLFRKILNFLKIDNQDTQNNETEKNEEEVPEEPKEGVRVEDIFNKNVKLTGNIKYDVNFESVVEFYQFFLKTEVEVEFDCSTGTKYKVEKVIIDGDEYPVTIVKNFDDDSNKYRYRAMYIASDNEQTEIKFDKIILDNGAAIDINQKVNCMVIQAEPTFSLTGFTEDITERIIRINFKLVDEDKKLAENPTFTLKDSQGNIIYTKQIENGQNMITFKIPDPPTSLYYLTVTARKYIIAGYDDYTDMWVAYNSSHESSITTSILSSEIANKYPKKGETIEVIYNISSTKVVLIDKEDHSNQDKAIGISKLVINGKEYDTEVLIDDEGNFNEKYRVYYTAKDSEGIEELNVSKIIFTNGYEEEFSRTDKIDVLKDLPKITDFQTENNIQNQKITFKFNVSDEDNIIVNENKDIWAEVGDETQKVVIGENRITFDIDKLNQLYDFTIKATYDLDSNKLETEENDNSYTGNVIFDKKFVLTDNYGIEFSNIKKFNVKGDETEFFEKNEDIKITYVCKTKWPEIYPETLVINQTTYVPEKIENKENEYSVTVKADDTSGIKELQVNSVGLNIGNTVSLENKNINYEVLKDPVTVENFEYSIGTDNDKVELHIKIKDDDEAHENFEIEIRDENGLKINPSTSNLVVGENVIDFMKTTAGKYFVSIYSSYDRDTDKGNSENNFDRERIHYEIITVNTRYIEMKDIVDIELYTYSNTGKAQRVDSLSMDNLSVLDNCIVKVSMRDIPEFYSNITKYDIEENQLKLTLEYTDAMVYTGNEELKPLEVSLDLIEEDGAVKYQYENSFKSLVDKMRKNPNATFELTKDYDIDEYTSNNDGSVAIIDFEFSGTIKGNGHKIYNLRKPLFNILKDATVEDFIIDKPVPSLQKNTAVLAKTINNTNVRNIHIINPICAFENTCGIIALDVENNSLIENCSITDISGSYIGYAQNTGGFVVNLKDSTIKNCLAQGRINYSFARNASFVRYADKDSVISNNIVDINYTPHWGNDYGGNSGFVHTIDGALLKNNICLLGAGNAYTIYINGNFAQDSKDNYQLAESTAKKNDEDEAVKSISKNNINADFFRRLGFSEDIWNIPNNTSFSNLPTLKDVSVSFSDEGEQPSNKEVYIPDYNRVYKKINGYDKSRDIIYNNMYKLMPFYDTKELINDGNKIPIENDLNKKLIKYIVPFNKEGKMVTYLSTDNYNSLEKIKIVFKDGSMQQYHIDFDDYYGNVASYMISDLKIGYNYNKYIVNTNSDIVHDLIEEASKYDFTKDLEPLTEKIVKDSRLYKEHFNKTTKNRIPEFVINSLVNLGYSPNFESDLLNRKIKEELINKGKLKELLFAFNYFTYWYDLDMQGVNVADALMFQSNQMFDKRLTLENMAKNLIKDNNSETNATANFYNNNIASLTKISNLGLFLDHFVNSLTTFKDGNEWFKANFKGGIYETVYLGEGVDYTIWDHVKKDGKVQTDILPALKVPENSMFIISAPTQVCFGSLRVYIKNPNDPAQIEKFRENELKLYLEHIKCFYKFPYDFWGKDTLNKHCDVQYDMRTTYTGNGERTVYNNPLTTEENYHKYFIEAINRWAGTSGAAYANGNEVYWNVIKMLDGGFRVSTHETLHNQDSKIFMNGYGRRGDAEDYAAGFMQQYYRDGWVSPNIFDENPASDNTTQNLHRSTVETEEKLETYYKNYFNTNDFLDYIAGLAFLELDNDEKANVAVQVSYPKVAEDKQEEGDSTVGYTPLTTDEVQSMNLTTVESLWDNRIMLMPGVSEYRVCSPGADTDSIFNIHWYQPHADNSRPDGANFKYIAWQMAGERGFKDGLVAYYSASYVAEKENKPGQQTTDLIALRYIMRDPNITYKQYKKDRYDRLSQYYKNKNIYIDGEQFYNEYLKALKEDATNKDRNLRKSTDVKRKYFKEIRDITKDFTIDPFSVKNN